MDWFLGEIRLFGLNFEPEGWAFCDGRLLRIQEFTALYSLLGTAYGGDGVREFALPDLQARVAVRQGDGPGLIPYDIGETDGAETVTLEVREMGAHSHFLNASQDDATSFAADGNVLAVSVKPGSRGIPGLVGNLYGQQPNGALSPRSIGGTGGGQPHNNMQPYLTLNYCIALVGDFPQRA